MSEILVNNFCKIDSIQLYNFRNYDQYKLNFTKNFTTITGSNGIGKTNILEAISLFAPGKGLRSAKLDEYTNRKTDIKGWSVQCKLSNGNYKYNLFTAVNPDNPQKRIITINDEKIRTQADLANNLNIMWLTPQMDGIFLEGGSIRRKFMDRIVFNFEPEHAFKVSIYEGLLRERLKCLQNNIHNNSWLEKIEQQLADMSLSIAKSRNKIINHLLDFTNIDDSPFPSPTLKISCSVDKRLSEMNDNELISWIQDKFKHSRINDLHSNRNNFGIQRADLKVIHSAKEIGANLCSTGEQKALLISIILAVVNAKLNSNNIPPILLLDEIVAHLDPIKRNWLLSYIYNTNLQTFVTSTDIDIFDNHRDYMDIITL